VSDATRSNQPRTAPDALQCGEDRSAPSSRPARSGRAGVGFRQGENSRRSAAPAPRSNRAALPTAEPGSLRCRIRPADAVTALLQMRPATATAIIGMLLLQDPPHPVSSCVPWLPEYENRPWCDDLGISDPFHPGQHSARRGRYWNIAALHHAFGSPYPVFATEEQIVQQDG
jgi:hypothetical protein